MFARELLIFLFGKRHQEGYIEYERADEQNRNAFTPTQLWLEVLMKYRKQRGLRPLLH